MSESLTLSIVMPVWREASGIVETLTALQPLRDLGHEVIVVDGGSDDGTASLARPLCDRCLVSEPGRAAQMNAGAHKASGNVLLFLHADTRLPEDALAQLQQFHRSARHWGRFDVQLSGSRPLFRLVSWMINRRSRLSGIATGDQGIFVRTSVFDALGGYASMPLMEDVELSRRLKLTSRPFCIRSRVVTDSRRWEVNGAWRTIFLMWRLRWRFWRGESPESLAAAYKTDVRHAPDS